MVSKELLDEAIDHAVITMRNVRKKPVRDNNFGVVRWRSYQ
jgi:putative ABC transport system permease protein